MSVKVKGKFKEVLLTSFHFFLLNIIFNDRFERVIMAFSNYVIRVSLDREYQNYCQGENETFILLGVK